LAVRADTSGRAAASRRGGAVDPQDLERLLEALRRARDGDFSVRLPARGRGLQGELGAAFNELAARHERMEKELTRVCRSIGREGKLTERMARDDAKGSLAGQIDSINAIIDDLVRPTNEVARVLDAVARGDLSQRMALRIEDRPVKGEFLRIGRTVNAMVDQLSSFADEVTRVAREVGTEGKLGGQAKVKGVSGVWKDLTDNVNTLADNLSTQVRNIAEVTTAVANGDLSKKVTVDVKGEILELKQTINTMVDQLSSFADEVTRVAREVGTEGALGGQAKVKGVSGTWKDLTDSVNFMATNLTTQVRGIAKVVTAVANGDLDQKFTIEAKGEVAALADTINSMIDTLRVFAEQVTAVAREVGTEGILGGQAEVPGVAGTWKGLTDNVNFMANNLTTQMRNIADVTTAVANGDLSRKITVEAKGEVAELSNTINVMVDQLSSFAAEVTRVAKEVGTEGRLGGQATVEGVSGVWRGLTDNVNLMVYKLTDQVRDIAAAATAVAQGDLSQKVTADAVGEFLVLKNTFNTMVDQLSSFADEVTRVAREVGTEGVLGGQAQVQGVSGVWKDLTDNVNTLADNLSTQVRNIAEVTTAVATGDLSKKITVDVRGEVLQLKQTINTMVDQLRSFAAEVTRVAREVGTEGKLGGQANVEGVSGTWKDLTDNVNQMAASLTTQVRAIADVSTAVTQGDLTRSVAVEAQGEVAELKDNVNQMIANLAETTRKNAEQDWLNSNLARFTGLMQGERDLETVSHMIMSELTPLVGAHHGAFFLMNTEGDEPELRLIASYAYKRRKNVSNRFALGEGLVGQAALERTSILVSEAPSDYIRISSGLGEAPPQTIVVIPVLFEDQVMAVLELASFDEFGAVHQAFLDQLTESIGVVLNVIAQNMRTDELLQQSQTLAEELQNRQEELQAQQEELKRSNAELEEQAQTLRASEELLQQQQEELQQTNEELEEKAQLLEEQNRRIEIKNREIELARAAIEEKAEQLALSSRYKSEFLANMSHELRTPLNSLLILAKLLAENADGNLTDKQVEFSRTIYTAGSDLLDLINDILDLSKVEAGKMDVHVTEVPLADVRDYVERTFQPLAEEKGLGFAIEVSGANVPPSIVTDEQRFQQILKNLLSNAVKFTERGSVKLTVGLAAPAVAFANEALARADSVLAFTVSDTGIGIAEEKLRHVFDAFQQADGTTSRRYGGTGLGLSISREIARLLGGEIRAESVAGAGSTFTLYLPATYPEQLAPAVPGPEAREADWLALPRLEGNGDVTGFRPDRALLELGEVADDRGDLEAADRVVLIVDDDGDFARTVLAVARERGFKGIVALRGDTALALAHEWKPDAVILDMKLPDVDGWSVLEQLKHHPETRHIPVHVISGATADGRRDALRAGAFAFLPKPVEKEALEDAFAGIASFIERTVKTLLVVEDDDVQRRSIVELVGGGDDVEIVAVGSSEEALAALEERYFDCMVLDLKLPEMTGFALLEKVKKDERFRNLPIIIYTGKELTRREETKLRKYAETIIVKDVSSPERLLDETALFLHRVEARLPRGKRRILEQLHSADAVFQGRKVLIVDDDVRNVFALTSVLESHGMEVLFAENGRDGLETLRENPDVELVLMDIMMPEMDGYEAMRAIRSEERFEKLPIISLTAKAMKGDREKSIASGASDYVAKPVDTEQLLSLLRVWLYR
jgi:CheY-like chemotaxis protein/HAMP domain-containing protein/GAF domain-containing protein